MPPVRSQFLSVWLNGIVLDVVRIRLTLFIIAGCTAREATSLPYSVVGVLWEFAQPGFGRGVCAAREANSLSYSNECNI